MGLIKLDVFGLVIFDLFDSVKCYIKENIGEDINFDVIFFEDCKVLDGFVVGYI